MSNENDHNNCPVIDLAANVSLKLLRLDFIEEMLDVLEFLDSLDSPELFNSERDYLAGVFFCLYRHHNWMRSHVEYPSMDIEVEDDGKSLEGLYNVYRNMSKYYGFSFF